MSPIREITDAERVKGLLEVNARQVELINRLGKALNLQRRTSADLRRRLEEAERDAERRKDEQPA